jgi:hypothetical protein
MLEKVYVSSLWEWSGLYTVMVVKVCSTGHPQDLSLIPRKFHLGAPQIWVSVESNHIKTLTNLLLLLMRRRAFASSI